MSAAWRAARPLLTLLAAGLVFALLLPLLLPAPRMLLAAPGPEALAERYAEWSRQSGAPPDARQREALRQQILDESMLLEEALRLGLHRSDPVARERLLQNMRFLGLDETRESILLRHAEQLDMHRRDPVVRRRLSQRLEARVLAAQPLQPGPGELEALYAEQLPQLQRPARIDLFHVFVPGDEAAAAAVLAQLRAADMLPDAGAAALGRPFLHGHRWRGVSERELGNLLGPGFMPVLREQGLETGRWLAPVASSYGWHLVWIENHEAAQPLSFEQALPRLRAQWRAREEHERWRAYIRELRQRYVVISSAAPDSDAS